MWVGRDLDKAITSGCAGRSARREIFSEEGKPMRYGCALRRLSGPRWRQMCGRERIELLRRREIRLIIPPKVDGNGAEGK